MGSHGGGGDTHPGAGRGNTAGSGKGSVGMGLEALLGGQGESGGDGGFGRRGERWSPLVSPGTYPGCHPRWLGDVRPPRPTAESGPDAVGWRQGWETRTPRASPERALPCRWVPKPGQLPGRCQDPADGNATERAAMTEPLSRFSESAWGADVVSAALCR